MVQKEENLDRKLAQQEHREDEYNRKERALADAQKPLPRFDLKKSIMASVTTENSVAESPNVVAKLEGADPSLKNEYVLVSAHLDHLGVGSPGNPV